MLHSSLQYNLSAHAAARCPEGAQPDERDVLRCSACSHHDRSSPPVMTNSTFSSHVADLPLMLALVVSFLRSPKRIFATLHMHMFGAMGLRHKKMRM